MTFESCHQQLNASFQVSNAEYAIAGFFYEHFLRKNETVL